MLARGILGSGRTCGVSFRPFPNSSGWRWLISSVFLIRISCHKTTHANGYYGAWPGRAVSIGVLPLTPLSPRPRTIPGIWSIPRPRMHIPVWILECMSIWIVDYSCTYPFILLILWSYLLYLVKNSQIQDGIHGIHCISILVSSHQKQRKLNLGSYFTKILPVSCVCKNETNNTKMNKMELWRI